VAYLTNRYAMDVGHDLAYRQRAFAPHARTHPTTGECLALIWTHTATGSDLPDFSRGHFLATTDDSLIRRQLEISRGREGVIEKTTQPTLVL